MFIVIGIVLYELKCSMSWVVEESMISGRNL